MRNYIILNGNNSNEITGLLIQTLPPISQPKIRTNIEEIDGRDGDIITKLGYSAYDKEISIGLYGNYDVDDIIKYFTDNQSGKVTFSDEPDKYYYYEILDQVDFDKLIRYRTATVTLHCQPFKYSTTEEKIQIDATEVSGSGSSITLNNTEDGALFTSLQINGDTSQNGTPTPSAPINVDVVTGDNTIEICGKNLFDIGTDLTSWFQTGNNGLTINNMTISRTTATISGSILTINSYDTTSYTWISKWLNLKKNTDYIISGVNDNDIRIVGLNSNTLYTAGTLITTKTNSNTTKTFNSGDYNFYCLSFYPGASNKHFENIMIEQNSTATSYVPYVSQTYSVDLGSIELCKIGDYQDYIYKENGNWYKYNAVGKVVLDGTEAWTLNASASDYYEFVRYGLSPTGPASYLNATTNYFSNQTSNRCIVNGQAMFIRVPSSANITTAEQFKTWLGTHNTIVYYVLATPTTTQITDTDLISQLEALIGATTYLGQTNIITSGSTLNPLLDVTTYAVDDPSFVITNSGNFKSKPIITIYGLGTIGLYLNGIQVLSLDMGETTSQITIDVAKLEAYNQETGALMNRSVTGDYNNLSLNVGENTITESGTLQGIEIENYSRWL